MGTVAKLENAMCDSIFKTGTQAYFLNPAYILIFKLKLSECLTTFTTCDSAGVRNVRRYVYNILLQKAGLEEPVGSMG